MLDVIDERISCDADVARAVDRQLRVHRCHKHLDLSATQRVDDVHAFPGHIACDADSRSELVVPIVRDGVLLGVLDLDSPMPTRFDEVDARGVEALALLLSARI